MEETAAENFGATIAGNGGEKSRGKCERHSVLDRYPNETDLRRQVSELLMGRIEFLNDPHSC
jgi:hypothetical protein